MRSPGISVHAVALAAVAILVLAMPVCAQDVRGTAVIWVDRGDVSTLDLANGPGGADRGPGSDFTFLKESTAGTSPKFDVEDEHGTKWKVKLGEEAKSETAVTRLLWAAGYIVDEDYYLPRMRVRGLPRLARGEEFVSDGNAVAGARLERDGGNQDSRTWSWYDNPFVGTREFNGLRVMMALVNNWDLKEINNGATGASNGGGQYRVTDLGATLGRTGNSLTRSKDVLKDYQDARFIEKVTPTYVDFGMHSRPFLLSIFNIPNYRFRTRMESVVKRIPIADARWIGDRLGELSSAQIADCFRAAGFPPADGEAYAQVVIQRIAALKALGDGVTSAAATTDTRETRCLDSTCREVPFRETLTAIKLGTTYARAIVGGFDQGAGIGGGMELSSGDTVRGLEFRAVALTSTQLYRRFDLEVLAANIGGSRNHADVWFSALHRQTDFFGIGPRTTDDPTTFALTQQSYQASLSRDLTNHLQSGAYVQVMNSSTARGTGTAGTPIDQSFSGTPDQGVARWIPGFLSRTPIRSYGGFIAYDTRDNGIGLTRGLNLYGRVSSADGFGTAASTQYGWMEKEFDARAYAPLGSPRTSLLLRSRGQFETPKAGGRQIPFYDLSWLGGRQYLRGYDAYRFRGNNVVLFSTELQQTAFVLTPTRGIDVFASADAGQTWGDARALAGATVPGNQDFSTRNWRSSFGGGLQYRHSRAIAARIELSRSAERSAIYASLSRGF